MEAIPHTVSSILSTFNTSVFTPVRSSFGSKAIKALSGTITAGLVLSQSHALLWTTAISLKDRALQVLSPSILETFSHSASSAVASWGPVGVIALPFIAPHLTTAYSCMKRSQELTTLKQRSADAISTLNNAQSHDEKQAVLNDLKALSDDVNQAIDRRKALNARSCRNMGNITKFLLLAGSMSIFAPQLALPWMAALGVSGLANIGLSNAGERSHTNTQIAELDGYKNVFQALISQQANIEELDQAYSQQIEENFDLVGEKQKLANEKAQLEKENSALLDETFGLTRKAYELSEENLTLLTENFELIAKQSEENQDIDSEPMDDEFEDALDTL